MGIPLIVHHVWPGTDAFPGGDRHHFIDWRLSWMKHHPDADFRFWRTAVSWSTAESWMPYTLRQLLDDPRYSPVVKSDVLRWAALFPEGGIYVDTDMECLAPMNEFLNDRKGCFVANEDEEWICTAIIAATPQHPFVKRMLDATLAALAKVSPEEANTSPNVITGPHLVTRMAKEFSSEITRHSHHRFYPIHYGRRHTAPLKDAVTNHHWAHGWKDVWVAPAAVLPPVAAPKPAPPQPHLIAVEPTSESVDRRIPTKPSTIFRIAIAHAAHRPERVASLQPMLAQLRFEGMEPVVFSSWQPEHHTVWARRIWTWAMKQSCPVLVLNDDVHLAPGFVGAVQGLLEAAPGEILSLHAQGPEVQTLLERGERWARLAWPTGPAYIIPDGAMAQQWLAFWDREEAECRHQKEDGVIAQWMKRVGTDTLACLPALVQHRVDVPSTYAGNDACANRQSMVPWSSFPGVDLLTWPSPALAAFVVPTALPAPPAAVVLVSAAVVAPVPAAPAPAPSRPARTLPPPKTTKKKSRFGGIYR